MREWKVTGLKTFRGNEGSGFNCTLWCDGKRVAEVRDMANGGCYDYEPSPQAVKKAYASKDEKKQTAAMRKVWEELRTVIQWLKEDGAVRLKQHPEYKDFCDSPEVHDLFVSSLVETELELRQVKRWCKTKTVLKLADDPDGQYITYPSLPTDVIRADIAKRYPTAEILNDRFA